MASGKLTNSNLITKIGQISLNGTGQNIYNSQTFDIAFPNGCKYVSIQLMRNATDTDVLDGKTAIRSFNTTGFTYAFYGSSGKGYVLSYMAYGF